jgi:hypothetical protein
VPASCKSAYPILLVTVLVLSLAGCAMHPTPIPSASPTSTNSATATPSPTTAPTPMDTPAPSPTITPPQIVLSDEQFACIGIGTSPMSLYDLTGIPKPTQRFELLQDFLLADGGSVHFDYAPFGEEATCISSITISGQAPLVEKPDAHPVADDTFTFRGSTLKVGAEIVLADLLAACGTPDAMSTVKGKAYIDDVWTKTLEYPGVTIALNQLLKPSDPAIWTILSVTLTESTHATARGLRVGMAVGDAVKLFGTGAFELILNMNGSSVAAVHAIPTQPPFLHAISCYLTVAKGRITTIATGLVYYDA